MSQRRLDPRDELAITTKVKTPGQVGKLSFGRHGATRDRAIASAVETRRLGVSGPLISSKAFSLLPTSRRNSDKDQVL
jgi:hypothetical protein